MPRRARMPFMRSHAVQDDSASFWSSFTSVALLLSILSVPHLITIFLLPPYPCRYVRNTTARAFSVVASALGIPALLPFLKAVCLSKKSWQVRVYVCILITEGSRRWKCPLHLRQVLQQFG